MPLPITVHRIVVRYQDETNAFELSFTPEQIRVVVVHERGINVVPPGSPKSTVGSPGSMGSLDGIAAEMGTEKRPPTNGQAVVSWRADTGPWHVPELGAFRIVEVELEYDSAFGGNFVTVLNPDTWDHVICRRVRSPDLDYRVPDGANGWRVRRAQDLLTDPVDYVLHTSEAPTMESEAMVVGKHRWDCTWYGLE